MNKGLLPLFLLAFPPALAAQQQADAYYDPAAMAAARERLMHEHGGHLNYLVLGERLEGRVGDGRGFTWEAQGWVGGDLNRLWLKTEGSHDAENDEVEEAEVQILFSRALSPWWDLQAGVRADFEPGPSRGHAVIGVQGLAPYWFEVDAAAFLDEDGRLGARLEAEYDLRLTQRLILQPRAELNWAGEDDIARGIGRGLHETEVGLRLRYEVRREFAPYVGVAWRRAFGGTADLRRQAGEEASEFSVLAGIRFWY